LCTTLAGWGSRTRSGIARAARRRRMGARAPAPVPDRADASAITGARAAGRDRGAAPKRLDGSGYPRGLTGGDHSPGRILAAADAYQAMREPRPHRPAHSADEASAELRADVKAGRLDADAVEAILGAAGPRLAAGEDRPVSPRARSRCSDCSRADCRPGRSPSAS
jgi:hypothetical protein